MSAAESTWLIAGLGNPGPKYARTRHNAGFMALERTAELWRIRIDRSKFDADFGKGRIYDAHAVLLKPMAYMNRSGGPIARAMNFFQIPLDHLLVIHDDIDIGYGTLKIKSKGGHGGHNGLRSIINAVGSGDFPRIRIGIGRPGDQASVTDHVLGGFAASEQTGFASVLDEAAEAAGAIIRHGIDEGMNRYNGR
jgi:PTH1 family peptidyl-tRNA hydrolase